MNLDDLYALEAAADPPPAPPFFACDPIVLSDELQAWPLDHQRVLWWLRPTVDDAFARFVTAQQLAIVTDDYHAVMQRWMAIRKELYT